MNTSPERSSAPARLGYACSALLIPFLVLVFAACDGGSSSGVSQGASTLRGTVVEVGDSSDRSGVKVSVRGSDRSTTTDSSGFFVLGGVPSGDREVVFKREPITGTLGLNIPRNSEVDLGSVRVQDGDGNATPSQVAVTTFDDEDNSDDTSGSTTDASDDSPSSADDPSEDSDSGSSGQEDPEDQGEDADSEDDVSGSGGGA